MNTFELHLLSADEPIYEGPCESLQFPCTDGQYGIQAGHEPMLAAVEPGLLCYRTPGAAFRYLSVSTGMVKADRKSVLILVDSAEWLEDIDENRARRDAEEAQRALRSEQSRMEYLEAMAALKRALSRLSVKGQAERYNRK